MGIAFFFAVVVTYSILVGTDDWGVGIVIVSICVLFIFGIYKYYIHSDSGKLEAKKLPEQEIKYDFLSGAGRGVIYGLVLFSIGTVAVTLNAPLVFSPDLQALIFSIIGGALFGGIFLSQIPPT